jgi:hypothetical protein
MGWPNKWREQGEKHCAEVRHDSISWILTHSIHNWMGL